MDALVGFFSGNPSELGQWVSGMKNTTEILDSLMRELKIQVQLCLSAKILVSRSRLSSLSGCIETKVGLEWCRVHRQEETELGGPWYQLLTINLIKRKDAFLFLF